MSGGAFNRVHSNSLVVDEWLTNYSEKFIQDARSFIAGAASTLIPVRNNAGKFTKYPRAYFLRDEMEFRPLGGAPVQVRYSLDYGNYFVDEQALEHPIDDRQRANTAIPNTSLDMNATQLLTEKVLIRRDRMWATNFFKTGVWSKDYTGKATSPSTNEFLQWNQAASDPMVDIARVATEISMKTGKKPNTIVAGANVHNWLKNSAKIKEVIKYTQKGIITDDLIAELFEVERYVVARSIYNSADETMNPGDTENIQWIVDANSLWIGYVERAPMPDAPTAVAMFAWTGYIPGVNQQGGVITRGRDDRAYTDYFHIRDAVNLQGVCTELGAFLKDAVSGGI